MKFNSGYIVTILFLFSFPKSGLAQWDVSAGPKLGVNFSTYDSKFIFFEPSKMKSSLTAGGFARVQPFDEFYFQLEVLVIGKGAHFPAFDSIPATLIKTSYLEFPIIIGFQPRKDFLDVQIGFAFSKLLSGFQEVEGSILNVKDEFHDWDLSVLAAIGFEFDPGIGVNARMTYGIINSLKHLQSNQVFTTAMNNFSLTFAVWYKIPIVKNRF
jgi:Outer membrane protein beta-barrel domain